MGLSQLDAESVLKRTFPFRSTKERIKTAKMPQKMRKSAEKLSGFPHLKNYNNYFC